MTGPMRTGAFTRSDVHEHLSVGRVGLYTLWGPSDAAGLRRVYVGKGVLRSRIVSHLRQKFWWEGGACVAVEGIDASDGILSSAERSACLQLEAAGACLLGNRNLPNGTASVAGDDIATALLIRLKQCGVEIAASASEDWSSRVLGVLDAVRVELGLERVQQQRATVYQRFPYIDVMNDSAIWAYPDRHSSWRGIEMGLGVLGSYRTEFFSVLEAFLGERVSSTKFPAVPTPWAGGDTDGFRDVVLAYFEALDRAVGLEGSCRRGPEQVRAGSMPGA
jgi:hypothetical protein